MGRYEFEQFNYSRAWRVRDHETATDYLGSYRTIVARVRLGGDKPLVEFFTAATGYKPTTSKQVTQMLYQWYGIHLDSRARTSIEREATVNGEYTGEIFAWYPSFFGKYGKDCDVMFTYDMGVHDNAEVELWEACGAWYPREIAQVAVNCDKFYL